ncbi:hypothetical protein Sste5344_002039 [Sporothrix stenoceras]
MQGSSARPYGSDPHDRYSYPSYGRPEDQQYPQPAGHMAAAYPPPTHLQGPPAMSGAVVHAAGIPVIPTSLSTRTDSISRSRTAR